MRFSIFNSRRRPAVVLVAFLAIFLIQLGCSSSSDPEAPVPDTTAPRVTSVSATDFDRIEVGFDESVDPVTAEMTSNYTIVQVSPAPNPQAGSSVTVAVLAAVLETPSLVVLTTDPMERSAVYELSVDGVADAKGNVAESLTEAVDAQCFSDPYGTISTWAGVPGRAAFDGDGHSLVESWLYFPSNLTFTSTGCYILDWNNHRLRHVTAQNTLETVMGTNLLGDGDPELKDRFEPGVPGTTIDLNHPTDVMELPNGRLLVSCWHNHKIREYDPTTGLAFVRIGAGNGYAGDGGDARDALLDFPTQTVRGSDGSLYILDQRNLCVRKVDPSNLITTICGTGVAGYSGDGGPPDNAQLNFPTGNNPPIAGALALDIQGRLYVSDTGNNRVRRIDFASDIIETVAGNGNAGYSGDCGDATAASLNDPKDIEIGPDGRLYIVDEQNNRIRAVDLTTGIITTVAGSGVQGFSGDGGPATKAALYRPWAIAFDTAGDLYIADSYNHVIRRVALTP